MVEKLFIIFLYQDWINKVLFLLIIYLILNLIKYFETGATSRECDGGLYEYYDFIKNSRNLSDNLFWIGAGRFFDQKAYSVLHYSPLVNSLKLLDLDMIVSIKILFKIIQIILIFRVP